jgi:hypothetical protein
MQRSKICIGVTAGFILLLLFFVGYYYLTGPRIPEGFVQDQEVMSGSNFFYKYDVVRYPSDLEIVGKEAPVLGFVTDPWNLKFGILTQGMSETRFVSVKNPGDKKVRVDMIKRGGIAEFVSFDREEFELMPGENVTIEVHVSVPIDAEIGKYTGEIDVVLKKPNFDFLDFIWAL